MHRAIFLVLLIFIACSNKPKMIPETLGKLKLEKYVLGKEASQMIDRMHISGNVSGEDNEVGFYSADTLTAVLYVSRFKNSDIAKRRLFQMLEKIAHGGTPFSLYGQVSIGNKEIYIVFGMAQSCYIYTDKDKLIWLSVDFSVSLEALHSLLKQKM